MVELMELSIDSRILHLCERACRDMKESRLKITDGNFYVNTASNMEQRVGEFDGEGNVWVGNLSYSFTCMSLVERSKFLDWLLDKYNSDNLKYN